MCVMAIMCEKGKFKLKIQNKYKNIIRKFAKKKIQTDFNIISIAV